MEIKGADLKNESLLQIFAAFEYRGSRETKFTVSQKNQLLSDLLYSLFRRGQKTRSLVVS